MPLSSKEIKEILAILEDSGWDEARVTIDDVTLAVSKSGLPPASAAAGPVTAGDPPPPAVAKASSAAGPPTPPPAAAEAGPAAAQEPLDGTTVESPSVGVFWRSPEPGAPPFVEVGSQVEVGETLCIVEVMKLMQHVAAEVAGTVTAIHVENSQNVEFGTPLFSIDPA